MTARRLGLCAGYLARMWGDRYTYKILMWKGLGKYVFERLMRLGDKFMMDVRVTGCKDWRRYSRLRVVSDDVSGPGFC